MRQGAVSFDYRLKPRLDAVASIGLVALASDASIERDWRGLLDVEGVGFYVGRVASPAEVTRDGLLAMEPLLVDAIRTLLPESSLDCVAYACTSASMFIGEAHVSNLIREVRPGVAATNPMTASRQALAALGARRVALLTPYLDEINVPMAERLESDGLEVVALGSFFNSRDPDVVRIDHESIVDAALKLVAGNDVDTLFIACTALGASSLVGTLESRTGLSVTTSNHALAWHALRLAGDDRPLAGRGRLFSLPLRETAAPGNAVNAS